MFKLGWSDTLWICFNSNKSIWRKSLAFLLFPITPVAVLLLCLYAEGGWNLVGIVGRWLVISGALIASSLALNVIAFNVWKGDKKSNDIH